jgi:hypothetical protein
MPFMFGGVRFGWRRGRGERCKGCSQRVDRDDLEGVRTSRF